MSSLVDANARLTESLAFVFRKHQGDYHHTTFFEVTLFAALSLQWPGAAGAPRISSSSIRRSDTTGLISAQLKQTAREETRRRTPGCHLQRAYM